VRIEEPLSHEIEVMKAPIFDRDEILQAPCDIVTDKLANYALEFAVLGYLDDAKDLVTLLNGYNFFHDARTILKPLWFAWSEIESWPEKEYERVHESLDDLAKQYYHSFFDGRYDPNKTEPTFSNDAQGLVQLLRAADELDPMSADATTGYVAINRSSALVKALDLRLALTEKDYAVVSASSTTEKTAAPHEHLPTVEEILGRIAARLHGNSQIRYLAQSARAWKILKNGALAKAIGVQDAKVTDLAQRIRDAFSDRFRDGRQILPADPMKDLIRVISDNTQIYLGTEEHRNEVGAPDEAPESLIRPGATIEKIAELERILGVKLPEDYKEFLSLSDGLGSSWGGILMESPLHPTSDVRWEDDEDYFTNLTLEILPLQVFSTCREFPGLAEVDDWPRVGRTIQIGQQDINVLWLLLPATVAKVRDAYLHIVDSKEAPEGLKAIVMNAVNSFAGSRQDFEKLDWCVLHWMSGGAASMIAYRSFKEFMADKARKSGTDYWAGEVCFAYGCC
jgi:hypothetical protein